MFKNETFYDLCWSQLRETHQKEWDKLERDFKFLTAYEKVKPLKGPLTLDKIAIACIEVCWDLLFTSAHRSNKISHGRKINYLKGWYRGVVENIKHTHIMGIDGTECIEENLISSNFLYNKFYLPLLDHLIVTFSYQFYCSNAERKTQKEYIEYIFNNSPTIYSDEFDYTMEKTNRLNGIHDGWNTMIKEAEKSSNAYLESLHYSKLSKEDLEKRLLCAPTFYFSHIMIDQWAINLYSPNEKTVWEFCNKNKYNENSKIGGLLRRLNLMMKNNRYLPLLFPMSSVKTHPNETDISFIENNINTLLFLWDDQNYCKTPKDPITYTIHCSKEDIQVDIRIQQAFNCYLTEKIFGIFSLNKIYGLQKVTNAYITDSDEEIQDMTSILRLRAPLLRIPLIDIAFENATRPNASNQWLAVYIDYWNSTALPILEELFLWAIYQSFSLDELHSAISDSFVKTTNEQCGYNLFPLIDRILSDGTDAISVTHPRCDRISFFRIVPNDGKELVKESKKDRILANKIVQYGYFHAMGLTNASKKVQQEEDTEKCSSSDVPEENP